MTDPTPTPTPPPAPAPSTKESALARFTYHGPTTGASLTFGTKAGELDGAPAEVPDVRGVLLRPGRELELPAEDPHVKCLVELGHLKPVAAADKAPAAKKKGGK